MKFNRTIVLLATSLLLMSSGTIAGALKPDCNAKNAGKNVAMKATIGVGGRCSPADAAKDSAKGVTGIEEKGALDKKGRKKDKKKSLKKEDEGEKAVLIKSLIKQGSLAS